MSGTVGASGARVFVELVANGFIVTTYAEHLPADDVRGRLMAHESLMKGPIRYEEPRD